VQSGLRYVGEGMAREFRDQSSAFVSFAVFEFGKYLVYGKEALKRKEDFSLLDTQDITLQRSMRAGRGTV